MYSDCGNIHRKPFGEEGITFMEWLGKESDEAKVPEDDEDEDQTENPLG